MENFKDQKKDVEAEERSFAIKIKKTSNVEKRLQIQNSLEQLRNKKIPLRNDIMQLEDSLIQLYEKRLKLCRQEKTGKFSSKVSITKSSMIVSSNIIYLTHHIQATIIFLSTLF